MPESGIPHRYEDRKALATIDASINLHEKKVEKMQMDEQVEVIADLRAQVGKEAEVEAVLAEVAVPSREEEGCIEYGFYRDRADATRILAFEIWANQDALNFHFETEHFKAAIGKLESLLAEEPVITQCVKII